MGTVVEDVDRQLRVLDQILAQSEVLRTFSINDETNSFPAVLALLAMAPPSIDWRANDHCFAITRLYGIFERFVELALGAWLRALQNVKAYSDLPSGVQKRFVHGIASVLRAIDHRRFSHVKLQDIATSLYAAVSGDADYQLLPEAFLLTDQNLRMDALSELLANAGMPGVEHWLDSHESLQAFFVGASIIPVPGEARGATRKLLKQLVDYRNDAAHGALVISEILGPSDLRQQVSFAQALCAGVADFVSWHIVSLCERAGCAKTVGSIVERFRGNIVIVETKNALFFVGQELHAMTKGSYYLVTVESIQVDDVDRAQVEIDDIVASEVGIKLSKKVAQAAKLIEMPADVFDSKRIPVPKHREAEPEEYEAEGEDYDEEGEAQDEDSDDGQAL